MNSLKVKLDHTRMSVINPPKQGLSSLYSKPFFQNSSRRCTLNLRACTNPTHNNSTSSKAPPPYAQPPCSPSLMASYVGPTNSEGPLWEPHSLEEALEKFIYWSRFVAFLGVMGSLIGSVLCFIKGCTIVAASYTEHFTGSGKAIVFLVEAIDVYLLGTVMLVFGMGLYELFISNLDIAQSMSEPQFQNRSNLFGLFTLLERPRWLEIKSVNELKMKVGHVIVMLLLIGLFDKSKKAAINSPTDLLFFSASVLLCSGCLYLLSKLNGSK